MRYGKYVDIGVGKLYLAEENGAVTQVGGSKEPDDILRDTGLLCLAQKELFEYFAGKRKKFTIPFYAEGTEFQKKVWKALREIPYGETRSYGEIAKEVGSPKGARAVGMACNRNPVMIFIPCHRVIGANGSLTGFGGGLPMKEFLLKLEGQSIREQTKED